MKEVTNDKYIDCFLLRLFGKLQSEIDGCINEFEQEEKDNV